MPDSNVNLKTTLNGDALRAILRRDNIKRKALGATYIAGPMRGIADYNYPAFFHAEAKLQREAPWRSVVNPARLEQCDEVDEVEPGVPTPEALRGFMRRDLLAILDECDSIYMLRGWESSPGARLEHALAVFLNLRINYEM